MIQNQGMQVEEVDGSVEKALAVWPVSSGEWSLVAVLGFEHMSLLNIWQTGKRINRKSG